MDDIEKAFHLCTDRLPDLPKKYKKWQTLKYYRNTWEFIQNSKVRERVCEENLAFDYLLSLYLWLKPGLVIQNSHILLCVQSVAAIIEAVMFDYSCLLLVDTKENTLQDELSRFPASRIRTILENEGILNRKWNKFIENLLGLRNYVHLQKTGNFHKKVSKYKPLDLNVKLYDFRSYMAGQYEKRLIPF